LGLTGDKFVSDINENQHHSRPSRFTLLIAVVVVFGIGVIAYWSEISTIAHISQIKQTFGL
jgi:CHASE3 domain sensor protein